MYLFTLIFLNEWLQFRGAEAPWEVCGMFPLASNFYITFGMIFIACYY